jgi:hypothetical protein
MGTNPTTSIAETEPTGRPIRPATWGPLAPRVSSSDPLGGTSRRRSGLSADQAIRTLQRLRAEADADATAVRSTPMSLDADTFRRFVSMVRH